MIVYRTAERADDSARLIDVLASSVATLSARGPPTHDEWVELLLDAGELETAVCDARHPEADDLDDATAHLRLLSRLVATGLLHSWYGRSRAAASLLTPIARELGKLARRVPATLVHCRTPEGYAHYSLFPETYIDAAEQFARSCALPRATVLGIRTIGTSLSAVVAATLAARGADVYDATVRPRGDPLERHLSLGSSLRERLRARVGGWFAVVDEGPGLSGSSFAAVANALCALGVPDERIVFLASWNADASSLWSARARDRWRRHPKFVGSFERLWLESGRLARTWNGAVVADWSAGAWRSTRYAHGERWPAVQPQHEQRKYVVQRAGGERLVVKFNGLGRYGRSRARMAAALGRAGFSPCSAGVSGGFLATRYVYGESLRVGDLTSGDAARVGEYLAAHPRARARDSGATLEEIAAMVELNVREGCGSTLGGRAAALMRRASFASAKRVAIDGRMLPHDWIRVSGRLLKTDGVAHHDDHFFPGCQDAAWDVAGACVELRPSTDTRDALIAAYAHASGDSRVEEQLPYWTLAYLAFRLGYTSLAAHALGSSADGDGMRALAARYVTDIRQLLIGDAERTA